jgi:photosystem II stability/assembly factor-like uncharacterized protein
MKIFGRTRFNSTIQAPSASFNKFLLNPEPTSPVFYVAGTETAVVSPSNANRSIFAQGLFNYVVYSNNRGNTFQQPWTVPGGSVMGYRVQHRPGTQEVYTLVTGVDTRASNSDQKTIINFSTNAGEVTEIFKVFPDSKNTEQFYGFDMLWVDRTKLYVVGARVIPTDFNAGTVVKWKKFAGFGAQMRVDDVAYVPISGEYAYYPAVFYSEDGGKTFNLLPFNSGDIANPEDAITSIAVNPDNQNTILYGTEKGLIYKSTAKGNNPTVVYRGNTIINKISFTKESGYGDRCYAALGGGFGKILKSTDAGTTWVESTQAAGLRFNGSIYDVTSPDRNTVLAVGDDYNIILKSTDAGVTWSKIPSNLVPPKSPIIDVISIIPKNTNFSTVALSKDTVYYKSGRNKLIDPNLSNTLNWENMISANGGQDFLAFAYGQDFSASHDYIFVLAALSNNQYEIISHNINLKFTISSPLPSDIGKPTAIFARTHSEIYIATETGNIIKATFNRLTVSFSFTTEISGTTNKLFSLDGGRSEGWVKVNTGNLLFASGEDGTLIYKNYSQSTWSVATAPTAVGHGIEDVIQIVALTDTQLYALTYDVTNNTSYVYKSTNGGVSWSSPLFVPNTGENYIRMTVAERVPATTPIFVITCLSADGQTLRVSKNDGSTWQIYSTLADPGSTVIAVDTSVEYINRAVPEEGSILIAGSTGIKLTDYIVTSRIGAWNEIPISLVGITGEAGYPFWACGGTTTSTGQSSEPFLLKSTDAGNTWQDASPLLPAETLITNKTGGDFILTSLSEGRYTVGADYDRYYLYRSDDEGSTFTKHDSNLYRLDVVDSNKNGENRIRDIQFRSNKIGYAVMQIEDFDGPDNPVRTQQPPNTNKLAKTIDGGITWSALTFPSNYNPVAISFVDTNVGYVYAEAEKNAPDFSTVSNKIFKTTNGGTSWTVSYTQPADIVGNTKRRDYALSIFFTDSNNGYAVSYLTKGVITTNNGGTSWSLVSIPQFVNDLIFGSRISFATNQIGYLAGGHINGTAGLYKTTNAGTSWSRVSTPVDSEANGIFSAVYSLTTKIVYVAFSNPFGTPKICKIYQTKNADSQTPTWTEVYQVRLPNGDLSTDENIGIHITDLQFSKNGKIGVAVGYRAFSVQVIPESPVRDTTCQHFILISKDGGDTWNEIDQNNIDLETGFRDDRGKWITRLFAVAFLGDRVITDVDPPLGPGAPDVEFDPWTETPDEPPPPSVGECFETAFLSSSYYNLENFAYKCTAFDKDGNPVPPAYYPNVSENVGLGRNIFGQLTDTNRTTLKLNLTYGAALGVNTLGTAVYSKNDTAVGYGAMDLLASANNNVAVGYKALSKNLQIQPGGGFAVNTNFVGISQDNIYTSKNGGLTWNVLSTSGSSQISSIANTTESILTYSDVVATSIYTSYILGNDVDESGSISNTYIFKSTNGNITFDLIYTSSVYTISKLKAANDSTLFGLDPFNGYVLKSPNGGITWETGSIQAFAGNTINNIAINSLNQGFLVGTYIWTTETGSINWVTSSYTGSNILYDIEYVGDQTSIAVGESGSIYKTEDDGFSWNIVTQSLTTNDLKVVSTINGGSLIAAGISGSIIYSSDLGNTWATASYLTTESFASYNYEDKDTTIPGEISLYSSAGNVKSIDGGAFWANTPSQVFQTDLITKVAVNFYSNTPFSENNALASTETDTTEEQLNMTEENVAIGVYSMGQHTNASGMVGVGAKTFFNTSAAYAKILPNNSQIILGDYYDFTEQPGAETVRASNYGQIAIGKLSQANSLFTSFNTSVGYASMFLTENSSDNTAIGFYSQHLSNGRRNTSAGAWSLGLNGKTGDLGNGIEYDGRYAGGFDNIAIGYKALLRNISSIRANQIIRDVFSNDKRFDAGSAFALGSENIAIGNEALTNVSGSNKVISIGHKANFNSHDITDSVFVGPYVGYNFKTPTGSYYNNEAANDWKKTQTVGIGSYAIYNQKGTDIVAIGSNALRGQRGALRGDALNNGRYAVVLPGILEGMIFSAFDLSKDEYNTSGYPSKIDQPFWLLDGIGFFDGQMALPPSNNCNQIKLQDIAISSKDIAYGLYLRNEYKGADARLQSFYPRLVKTDTLSNFASTDGKAVQWYTVDHVDPNVSDEYEPPVIPVIKGTIDLGPADSALLSAPTPDIVYILSKGTSVYGIYKSTDAGITFTTVLDSRSNITFSNMRLNSFVFSNASTGSIVGYPNVTGGILGRPFHAKTTNGASSWTASTIDNSDSGLGVELLCVWFNSNHSTGFAGGSHGSIYKTTNGGSSWTKLIGASHRTNFAGSVYSDFSGLTSAKSKKAFRINDIYFINESTGWAIGSAIGSDVTGRSFVLKTVDGGTTWTKVEIISECSANVGPVLTKIRAIDSNIVYVASNIGNLYYSTDGGLTWDSSDYLEKTVYGQWDPTTRKYVPVKCPPVLINALAVFVDDTNLVDGGIGEAISHTSQSVAIGSEVQAKQQFVEDNVAVGYKVQYNASGSALSSVQVGANTTLNSNYVRDTVAIGKDSLHRTRYADKTTAIGKDSLFNILQDPSRPEFPGPVIGYKAEPLVGRSDSTTNTVVGYQAGYSLLMGDSNVFVGANAGLWGTPNTVTYGSNNVNIGTNSPKLFFNTSNQIAIGNGQHNFAILWGQNYAPQPWWVQSDIRDKADTGSFTLGLDFVRQIQPKEFKWDSRVNYPSGSTPDGTYKQSGSSYGFIAQDIEAAAAAAGVSGSLFIVETSGSYSGSVDPSGSGLFGLKVVSPGMVDLVVFNAVKELDTTVNFLSASKYTTNLGNGSDTAYPVTHSLNTRDVIAMVYSNNTNLVVYPTMSIDSTNTMTVTFPTIAMTNQYRLVVMR